MVFIAPLIGAAALYAGFATAAPSSYGSSYGGSSDSSSSGSSDSSYGGSSYGGSSYGGSDNSKDYSSSSMMEDKSSSTMMMNATSTAMAYSTPSYGSGMSSWGGSGYSDCVQQCMMENPPSMGSYMPSSTMNSSDSSYSGSKGSGATHTVIVAPTQGVLRYVPFAINASVGDTVMFMWGANNHTVTKSSQLLPCNKSADAPFISGEHDKSFMFSQLVNDTKPTFYYCGTTGHCEKGMFGIINPPNAAGSGSSVSSMMPSMMNMSSDMAAMSTYTDMKTANNSAAAKWGSNIDMGAMPGWSQQYVATNVMYTRTFLAANPETLTDDGRVDLSAAGKNPLMIPADITAANAAAAAAPAAAGGASSAAPAASSAPATPAAAAAAKPSNGAGALASPTVLVGLAAVVASFFAL